ncbi:hypothetical protein BgiMline_025425 [Biomphalaria glabrata]|nr:hypothetical protein BgiMline_021523 [Biomphalaria glabrata]
MVGEVGFEGVTFFKREEDGGTLHHALDKWFYYFKLFCNQICVYFVVEAAVVTRSSQRCGSAGLTSMPCSPQSLREISSFKKLLQLLLS